MTAHHRFITGAAVTLAFGASAAPTTARPVDLTASGSEVPAATYSPTVAGHPSGQVPPATTSPSRATSATIVRVSPGNGFDWGDAGIGAAGGVGLSMLALGGGLLISQRRERRPSRSATAAS